MTAIGDFHLHSTASDGIHTPTWLMETAAAKGVRVLSLTDHDSTEGLAEARAAAARLGLRLIPGLELSTDYGTSDIHLLAFGMDVAFRPLQDFLQTMREGRIGRVIRIVEILKEVGAPIELSRVLQIAGDATVGRPHVARALMERGHVASVQEAFDRWLGNGKAADVPRPKQAPEEAIKTVHDNGGLVFVAHPVFITEDYAPVVDQLAAWGVDGVETYYKFYDAPTVAYHRAMADRLGLATSGGSDYHGLGNPDDRDIADIPFPDEEVQRFVTYLEHQGVNTGLAGNN